jgi:hypothetical protein
MKMHGDVVVRSNVLGSRTPVQDSRTATRSGWTPPRTLAELNKEGKKSYDRRRAADLPTSLLLVDTSIYVFQKANSGFSLIC